MGEIDKLIKENKWDKLKTAQDKVDAVLDYLHDTYWVNEEKGYTKDLLTMVVSHKEQVKGDVDKIAGILAKARGEDKNKIKVELNELIKGVKTRSPEDDTPLTKKELAYILPKINEIKGLPQDANYSGEDMLKLGYLIHSCTSLSILASDILTKLGVDTQVCHCREAKSGKPDPKDVQGHSMLRYKLEDGTILKCDPKYDRTPGIDKKIQEEFRTNPDINNWIYEVDGTAYKLNKVVKQHGSWEK
jgi:hypothetical protein